MIIWIFGKSGSGKTTLANKISRGKWTILDADAMRKTISKDLGFSKEDRWENNLRIAKLARELDRLGNDIVVATICPYRDLRKDVEEITGCVFIYLKGGVDRGDGFEPPKK